MTHALDAAVGAPRVDTPYPLTRYDIVNAGTTVPADALADRAVAQWVRSRGASVIARSDHDLDLVQFHGIRAVQVVYSCGRAGDSIRRAARLRAFGAPVKRIMLSGGSTQLWRDSQGMRLTAIMCAVEDAVRDECEKWQLSRPAISLAAHTAADTTSRLAPPASDLRNCS